MFYLPDSSNLQDKVEHFQQQLNQSYFPQKGSNNPETKLKNKSKDIPI